MNEHSPLRTLLRKKIRTCECSFSGGSEGSSKQQVVGKWTGVVLVVIRVKSFLSCHYLLLLLLLHIMMHSKIWDFITIALLFYHNCSAKNDLNYWYNYYFAQKKSLYTKPPNERTNVIYVILRQNEINNKAKQEPISF